MATTIVGFSTHTPMGAPTAMQAGTSNVMEISSSIKQGIDLYSARLDVTSGGTQTYLRIRDRNSDGINTDFNLDQIYGHTWFNFTKIPGTIVTFMAVVNGLSIIAFNSGVLGAIRPNGRLAFYDNAAIGTGTANLTFTNSCTQGSWYRLDWMFKQSDGAWELKLYNEAGTLIEAHDSVSDAATWDFGGANFNSVFLQWHNSFSGASTTPTFTIHYGGTLVASGGYPSTTARIGMQLAFGEPTTLNGWYAGAGNLDAAVHTRPPDGNASYMVSVMPNSHMLYRLVPCEIAGIPPSSTIHLFSPFYIGWDMGGAVTLGTRFVENGTTTDTGMTDPAATVDFHLRGLRVNTMPSDASVPTSFKLDQMRVGVVRDSTAVEVRVGLIGNHVVYTPIYGLPGTPAGSSGQITYAAPIFSPPPLRRNEQYRRLNR